VRRGFAKARIKSAGFNTSLIQRARSLSNDQELVSYHIFNAHVSHHGYRHMNVYLYAHIAKCPADSLYQLFLSPCTDTQRLYTGYEFASLAITLLIFIEITLFQVKFARTHCNFIARIGLAHQSLNRSTSRLNDHLLSSPYPTSKVL
jgi:hypothetical protein